MSYTNLTLLVSSFDEYSACWAPFCHGLNKYWPEHPSLFFITNFLEAPDGVSLKLGNDQGWAKNLLRALDMIPTDYILYAQEDYWIKKAIDNQNIIDFLGYLESGLADYIRLYPAPGPDSIFALDERLGIIAADAEYRTSLQMSLWRKETLKALVRLDETPWQFEVNGSKRSQGFPYRFLCVTKRRFGIDYVFTAIVNGYWTKEAYSYNENEGINVSFADLPKKPLHRRIYDHLLTWSYKKMRGMSRFISKVGKSLM